MAIHSDAEEISVYNEYQKVGLKDEEKHNKGQSQFRLRLTLTILDVASYSNLHLNSSEEHAQVKKLVYDADMSHPTSDGYDDILGNAVRAFDTHAKEEEDHDHPKMRAALSPEENDVRASGPFAV